MSIYLYGVVLSAERYTAVGINANCSPDDKQEGGRGGYTCEINAAVAVVISMLNILLYKYIYYYVHDLF